MAIRPVGDGSIPGLILTNYCLPLRLTGDQVAIEILTRLGFKPPRSLVPRGIATSVADRAAPKPAAMNAAAAQAARAAAAGASGKSSTNIAPRPGPSLSARKHPSSS